MTGFETLPQYNDAESERRAKLAAQSLVSVDKPGVAAKPFRIRNMKVKPTRRKGRKARDRRNPEFY